MKNAIQAGEVVELTAPSGGVTSGVAYVVGSIFVIALADADEGDPFSGVRIGVHQLPKNATEAVTEGQIAYWDDSAKAVRNATGAGRFIIGSVREAQLAATTYVRVILNGTHVVAI